NKLLDKFSGLIDKPTEVKSQKAGVRPSTRDRRPFVGLHPEHKTIGIFNGLGTKGLSLAPYFAEELIAFIENNSRISTEANIERYYSLYLSPK
ncbi:MAG: FAD-dependent oxidoreductase, partial [Cyclobacteriaceae bacterium]|nr:FAD-dependent oxidoreductase [Cyclobacteriaceae bacterium]